MRFELSGEVIMHTGRFSLAGERPDFLNKHTERGVMADFDERGYERNHSREPVRTKAKIMIEKLCMASRKVVRKVQCQQGEGGAPPDR